MNLSAVFLLLFGIQDIKIALEYWIFSWFMLLLDYLWKLNEYKLKFEFYNVMQFANVFFLSVLGKFSHSTSSFLQLT